MNHAISYLRVIAISVIVFYHCLCFYGIWKQFPDALYFNGIEYCRTFGLIAVNAFVFISGYLFAHLHIEKGKYREYGDFYKKKIKRLLLPYCLWGIIVIMLFPGEHPWKDYFSGVQHLWFLLMLFGVFVVSRSMIGIFLKLSDTLRIGIFFSFLICNQIVTKYVNTDWNYLAWMQILKYIPTFIVGILMVTQGWEKSILMWKTHRIYLCLAISIFMVILIAVVPRWPLGMLYMNLPTYALLVFLFAVLNKSKKEPTIPIIKSLDKSSFGIYIIHHILIWAILIFVPSTHQLMNVHYILAPTILFVIVINVSWVLTILLKMNKFTSALIGA